MTSITLRQALTASGLAAAILSATASLGLAEPIAGYVTAESRFGNGSIEAPVRATARGYQVRLPRGTWVYCRRSCAETLRVETIDVFENQGSMAGYGALQNECGIFGCLELRYPR